MLNLRTGYIPPGTTAYPFTINENGSVVSYVPPICIAPQILVNGVCEDSTLTTTPPVCIAPQILVDSACKDPAPITMPTICIDPQILVDGVCKDLASTTTTPTPNSSAPGTGAGTSTGSGSDVGKGGLVKCGTERDKDNNITNPCGFNDVLTLINTIVKFILFNLALPIAAIMFAYAGFELVTSGGSTEKKSKAKEIFTNVAIGLIFVAAAFLIIQAILGIVGARTDIGINWFGF